jgi:cellulose synthase/poly-beta-1,6-N-acetylglucosamine synthase-like glycosyltransferase
MEPQQNISLTRNRALEIATGDLIAFIDDDEFATKRWLLTLFKTLKRYKVDGVLGPVKPYFNEKVPKWIVRGKFYDRPTYATGFVIDWMKGRTGNVLLRSAIFDGLDQPFSPAFHRAGDQDFFRRMIAKGYTFIWCNEAVAFEIVPPSRWTRAFMLKRALLRGTIGMQHPTTRVRRIVKAFIAVPIYTVALPFSLLLGQHKFMSLLIKTCNHVATLMTFIGVKPVRNQLLTD